MKTQALTLVLVASLGALTGCQSPGGGPDRTGTGALTGGAIGAGTGALIGGSHGRAGEGALIGGAIGAITGGLIGHSMDQEEQARLRQQAPKTYENVEQGRPLSMADVKALAAAQISDDVIINQIQSSRTVFRLNAPDIIELHNAGVSDKVINYMINTPSTVAKSAPPPQQTVYVAQPPPPPRVDTVVIAPGPGYVWIGGEWIWSGRWVWRTGYWAPRPRPHAVWVAGYWSDSPRGWSHAHGHWR